MAAGILLHFYNLLRALDRPVQDQFFRLGGLQGMFNLGSFEAAGTSIPQKRNCFEDLERGGIAKDVIKEAFITFQEREGRSAGEARHMFEHALFLYSLPPNDLESLKETLGPKISRAL